MADDTKPGRPFPPGVSGNPGGRPKGLGRRIRALIAAQKAKAVADGGDPLEAEADGWDLIALRLYKMAMGELEATERDQIAAAKLLYERADGHPRQNVKIEETPAHKNEIDWTKTSIEERRELLEKMRKLGLVEAPTTDGPPTEH